MTLHVSHYHHKQALVFLQAQTREKQWQALLLPTLLHSGMRINFRLKFSKASHAKLEFAPLWKGRQIELPAGNAHSQKCSYLLPHLQSKKTSLSHSWLHISSTLPFSKWLRSPDGAQTVVVEENVSREGAAAAANSSLSQFCTPLSAPLPLGPQSPDQVLGGAREAA